jgi:4-hydroxyphenylacetate 3-hydroxylase N terminal
MLATGRDKLERMRDGRVVYIGSERVDDVTRHPAFRHGAQTIADLFALKAAELGCGGLGIRRPPHAVREILRREFDHRPQPERPRSAVDKVSRDRR